MMLEEYFIVEVLYLGRKTVICGEGREKEFDHYPDIEEIENCLFLAAAPWAGVSSYSAQVSKRYRPKL